MIPAEFFLNYKPPSLEERQAQREQIDTKRAEREALDITDLPDTAELYDWVKRKTVSGETVYWGYCHGNPKFRQGEMIRTSLVVKVVGDRVVTLNSIYRLIGEGADA